MNENRHDPETVADALLEFLGRCEDKYPTLLSGMAAASYLGISVARLDGLSATNALLRPVGSCGCLAWRLIDLDRYRESLGVRDPSADLEEFNREWTVICRTPA